MLSCWCMVKMGQDQSSSKNARKTPVRNKIIVTAMYRTGPRTLLHWLKNGEEEDFDTMTIFLEAPSSMYKGVIVYNPGWGGRTRWRPTLGILSRLTYGLVFMVDSTDASQWHAAREELEMFVKAGRMNDTFTAIMADNQDLPEAKKVEEIEELLTKDLGVEEGHLRIFPIVASKGEGVKECLDWIIGENDRKQRLETAMEPWKEVANDMTEEGKSGLKFVKKNWKRLLSAVHCRQVANTA